MQSEKHHHYNKNLLHFARELRGNMTKAEAVLWKHVLRAGMMKGYTFNRQRPVLNYIADFMCKELKLVIEIDGISHHDEEVAAKDKLKDEALISAGFYIIRFSDREVLEGLDGVRNMIQSWIEGKEKC